MLGRRSRVRPRCLLRQQDHPGPRWLRAAHRPPCPLLLVAALARCPPLQDQPPDRGRDPRALHPRVGQEDHRQARLHAQDHGQGLRRLCLWLHPRHLSPRLWLARLPPGWRHWGSRPRPHQPLCARQALLDWRQEHGALPRTVEEEGLDVGCRNPRDGWRSRRRCRQVWRHPHHGCLCPPPHHHQLLARALHLAPAHRHGRSPLRVQQLELHQGCLYVHRPPLRPHLQLPPPRDRLHPRRSPH
mmetsp:Transcript_47917/g.119807  ORF Transcript_47917/g.119807 Transcript_47917/m.119807 type:complete len:243 (+) Transcript_47917:550-1278(+)